MTNTTKIAVKFYSLFERYNGPSVSANDIFGSVMQANPANFPKFFAYEDNLGYNHTLFGNKGNGGFPNPYADMVKDIRIDLPIQSFLKYKSSKILNSLLKAKNFEVWHRLEPTL